MGHRLDTRAAQAPTLSALPQALANSAAATAANGAVGSPWLVADIGGTNARFGWMAGAPTALAELPRDVTHVRTLPVADHAGPAQAARAYLAQLKTELGAAFAPPSHAAFAVATPICGDWVSLTNSPWEFSQAQVQSELTLAQLVVGNDFEALALSLPSLGAAQLRAHGPLPSADGPLAVIGPGTGLGVAGLVPTAHGWVTLPGEGGHASLGAATEAEWHIVRWLHTRFDHVSAERVLCGAGLSLLHEAVRHVNGRPGQAMPQAQVMARGLSGEDADCSETLDVFCAMLGGLCGNVALTLGARGGVYIGGGIVPQLGDRFFASQFRQRFEAKGRFEAYLRAIPTAVITDTLVALRGAGAMIARAQRH